MKFCSAQLLQTMHGMVNEPN